MTCDNESVIVSQEIMYVLVPSIAATNVLYVPCVQKFARSDEKSTHVTVQISRHPREGWSVPASLSWQGGRLLA